MEVQALCRRRGSGGGERGGGLNASSSSAAPLHQGGEGGPDAQLDLLLVRGMAVAVACKSMFKKDAKNIGIINKCIPPTNFNILDFGRAQIVH